MIGIKGKRDFYAVLTPEQRDKYKTLGNRCGTGPGRAMMKADSATGSVAMHLERALRRNRNLSCHTRAPNRARGILPRPPTRLASRTS